MAPEILNSRLIGLRDRIPATFSSSSVSRSGLDGRRAPPCSSRRWSCRLPAPSSAGLSFPQRPPRKHSCAARKAKETKPAKGLCPDRAPQGASPIFRAALVQTSASLRPFRSGCACSPRVGRPLPLHLATPAFARWRSAYGCRDSIAAKTKARTQGEQNHHEEHS